MAVTWPIEAENPFRYWFYDFLTLDFLGELPLHGASFSSALDGAGTLSASIDVADPRVMSLAPYALTNPVRTMVVVDLAGQPVWAGQVQTRKYTASSADAVPLQATDCWGYLSALVQAVDYGNSASSGPGLQYWSTQSEDPMLIAEQVLTDKLAVPSVGLSQTSVVVNGSTPETQWVAPSFPYTQLQTIGSIVTQLQSLGYQEGGFDFGYDLAYESDGRTPAMTLNLSYPRRGRVAGISGDYIDTSTALDWSWDEDGSQMVDYAYVTGAGTGALTQYAVNSSALAAGYPLMESVYSNPVVNPAQNTTVASAVGQAQLAGLAQGYLALYGWPPVTATATMHAISSTGLSLGQFLVGDDVTFRVPAVAGPARDPRFVDGMSVNMRITNVAVTVPAAGIPTMTLTLTAPPGLGASLPYPLS